MRPTPEAYDLMRLMAEDFERLAGAHEAAAATMRKVADALRRGDFPEAMMLGNAITRDAGTIAHTTAIAMARFRSMEQTDQPLWNAAHLVDQRRDLERMWADWDAERVQHEIERHEASCDKLGCEISAALRERLRELEAH